MLNAIFTDGIEKSFSSVVVIETQGNFIVGKDETNKTVCVLSMGTVKIAELV